MLEPGVVGHAVHRRGKRRIILAEDGDHVSVPRESFEHRLDQSTRRTVPLDEDRKTLLRERPGLHATTLTGRTGPANNDAPLVLLMPLCSPGCDGDSALALGAENDSPIPPTNRECA